MLALKKIWAFIKTYWFVPVLIIVAIVFKTKGNRAEEILEIAKDSHKKQLDAINNAEIEKQKSRQIINDEYENAIKEIEDKYAKENKVLTTREKNYIKSVVATWSDDPGQMAERITMVFGFQYVPKTNDSNTD